MGPEISHHFLLTLHSHSHLPKESIFRGFGVFFFPPILKKVSDRGKLPRLTALVTQRLPTFFGVVIATHFLTLGVQNDVAPPQKNDHLVTHLGRLRDSCLGRYPQVENLCSCLSIFMAPSHRPINFFSLSLSSKFGKFRGKNGRLFSPT